MAVTDGHGKGLRVREVKEGEAVLVGFLFLGDGVAWDTEGVGQEGSCCEGFFMEELLVIGEDLGLVVLDLGLDIVLFFVVFGGYISGVGCGF